MINSARLCKPVSTKERSRAAMGGAERIRALPADQRLRPHGQAQNQSERHLPLVARGNDAAHFFKYILFKNFGSVFGGVPVKWIPDLI